MGEGRFRWAVSHSISGCYSGRVVGAAIGRAGSLPSQTSGLVQQPVYIREFSMLKDIERSSALLNHN